MLYTILNKKTKEIVSSFLTKFMIHYLFINKNCNDNEHIICEQIDFKINYNSSYKMSYKNFSKKFIL